MRFADTYEAGRDVLGAMSDDAKANIASGTIQSLFNFGGKMADVFGPKQKPAPVIVQQPPPSSGLDATTAILMVGGVAVLGLLGALLLRRPASAAPAALVPAK